MKTKACVLLVSAVTFVLMVPISPVGAATGSVCKTESGTITFSPTLPKFGNTKLVNATGYVKGTLGGCNNGVTGGTFTAISKLGNVNCKNAGRKAASTEKITWTPASNGTSTLRLSQVGSENGGVFTGTVTEGRFKGTNVTIHRAWVALNPGACQTTGLKTIKFKSTAVHI
jgi:hypothetical protein